MNWIAFAILSWVFLGLEKGLKDALALGSSGVAPSFVFALLTFITMSAPPIRALWIAIALGLCMDLIFEVPLAAGDGSVTIIGPWAVSYVAGTQLILALRGLMIRRNPLTMGFLAMCGAAVAGVILACMLGLRNALGAGLGVDFKSALLASLGSALYTGVLATVLAFPLIPLSSFLGLPSPQQRKFGYSR